MLWHHTFLAGLFYRKTTNNPLKMREESLIDILDLVEGFVSNYDTFVVDNSRPLGVFMKTDVFTFKTKPVSELLKKSENVLYGFSARKEPQRINQLVSILNLPTNYNKSELETSYTDLVIQIRNLVEAGTVNSNTVNATDVFTSGAEFVEKYVKQKKMKQNMYIGRKLLSGKKILSPLPSNISNIILRQSME